MGKNVVRMPVQGQPDFSRISDEKLVAYRDLVQELIFVYKYCDAEKVGVLTEAWKQMSDEYTDRLCHTPFSQPEECEPVVRKIKTVKSLKHIKR